MEPEKKKLSMQMEENIWNEQHEQILRQWGETCSCYRFMHNRSYLLYKDMNMRFSLPVIVLSTITGTANFAQSTLPENMKQIAPSVIGCLNLVAGLVATVMQFLKVNELMENHRTAALAHGLLSRNIRLMLAIPHNQRYPDGLKFVEDCKTEYDSLLDQSPDIPKKIMTKFEQLYPSDNLFSKPEILNVKAIPLLTPPKTIEPVEAITKNTPLEAVGKFLSGTKLGTTDNELIQKEKKDEIKIDYDYPKNTNQLDKPGDKVDKPGDKDYEIDEDDIWNDDIDIEMGNFTTIYSYRP
tara:strand:+ start:1290 stop:2177 length:888 start_codon:yes stop_codon:yes gene_type:complete